MKRKQYCISIHRRILCLTLTLDFVMTVNDLGVELVIEEALRNARKAKLKLLIDEALINKNENDFIQYTNEFKQLEAFLSE